MAGIKCSKCDARMEFGGMSASLRGSVSAHDAVSQIAIMRGWRPIDLEWRCPAHGEQQGD